MYKINYNQIVRSEKLDNNEKILLMELLIIKTKENSRKHIQNGDLQRVMNASKDTFRKTRDVLESQKLISILPHKAQRKGKPLHYKMMWTKLVRWNLVEKIENEYREKFYDQINTKKKYKNPIKEGEVLNSENVLRLSDDAAYETRRYRLDNNGERRGAGSTAKRYGKDLRFSLKAEANATLRGEQKEFEYVFKKIIK